MNAIRDRVREALCIKDYICAPFRGSEPDKGYPDTHLDTTCIKAIFDTIRPAFWLEFGSMVGASAVKALFDSRLMSSLLQAVYLDSAHIEKETYMELEAAGSAGVPD